MKNRCFSYEPLLCYGDFKIQILQKYRKSTLFPNLLFKFGLHHYVDIATQIKGKIHGLSIATERKNNSAADIVISDEKKLTFSYSVGASFVLFNDIVSYRNLKDLSLALLKEESLNNFLEL